jgi:hypothetical protein
LGALILHIRDLHGRNLRGLIFLMLAGALGIEHAQADGAVSWMIQAPSQSELSPAANVEIALPAGLSASQLASLGIEIDQIDITALAHISANKILYTPPQPLGPGLHDLRVVEYASDGQLIPRGDWRFTVTALAKGAAGKRGWYVKGNVGGTLSERVAESDLTPPAPSALTGNGTFDLKAARTMAEWSVEGSMSGLAGTDNGIGAIGGQAVQPAQMQVALRHGKDNLILGDQALPFDNLAISGLSRRGVSGHLADLPLGTDLTAFSVRESSLAGFYGGFGFTDSGDVVSGALLQSHPLAGAPKALVVQVGVFTGTAPAGLSTVVPYPAGNGSFPPAVPNGAVIPVQSGSGTAWVVGLSSQIPGSTLQLNTQYAGSSFDFEGTSGQSPVKASDNAYSAAANYSHPLGDHWMLGANASYQDVGTYFTSLANPTLTPDRRNGTAAASLSGHGLSLAASGGFTEDNTDDNASIATVRSLPQSVSLSYAFGLPTTVTSWLGAPSLSLSRQDARTRNVTLPSGTEPSDSDVLNETLGLNFSYPHLTWQAGVTGGKYRDYTGQQDNTDNFGPTAGLTVTLGKSGSIGLNMQLIDSHDLVQDTHTLDHNYALNAADSFLSNKVTAQLTLSINRNTQQLIPGSIPPQLIGNDVVLRTASAQLTWHAVAATAHRGGLDIGLACSWNESSGLNDAVLTTQGYSALATTGFQGFLTFSSRWPLALGDQ